jgi:hypothetical protein
MVGLKLNVDEAVKAGIGAEEIGALVKNLAQVARDQGMHSLRVNLKGLDNGYGREAVLGIDRELGGHYVQIEYPEGHHPGLYKSKWNIMDNYLEGR